MNISSDDFWQSILDLDASLVDKIERGEKIVSFSDEHKSNIKSLLLKSHESPEWEKIIDHVAYWIYAGSVQNFNFAKANDALIKIIPIVNNLAVLTKGQPTLVAEIQKLQSIIKITNESRSRGGKNKDKAKQESMQQIEQAYKDKIASGYSFKLGLLSKFYTAMAEEHDLDFGSIKNRVEKLRQTLGHTARPKKQSS